MRRTSLLVRLSYVLCLVLATGLRAIGDHVTYQCSGNALHSGLPRLDEASIDDLNILQATGAVTSVDLVQVCHSSIPSHPCLVLKNIGIHRKNQGGESASSGSQ